LFFIFSPAYPYWFIFLTPFLPVLLFQNKKYSIINLVLDTALSGAMIILQQIHFSWCYSLEVMQPMLLPKIFGAVEMMKRPVNIGGLWLKFFALIKTDPKPLFGSIFTVCLVFILILNFPQEITNPNKGSDNPSIPRSLTWFRLLINGVICLSPIILYISSIIIYGINK